MRMLDALQGYPRRNRHQRRALRNKHFSLKEAWYIGMSILIVGAFINSQHVKIIEKPIIQKVDAQFELFPSVTPKPITSKTDERVKKLNDFFIGKNSPLADQSELFVKLADQYGLDYTLMPSISCKESSCGLALPTGSYNPFGLGGSNFMWFASWGDAIVYEARLLNENYRGNMIAGIKEKYCPASDNCATNWTEVVMNTQYEIINK